MFEEEVRTDHNLKKVFLVIGGILVSLFIPGVRRLIFRRILGNKFLRHTVVQFVVATPYIREKLINQIVPPQKGLFGGKRAERSEVNNNFHLTSIDKEDDDEPYVHR